MFTFSCFLLYSIILSFLSLSQRVKGDHAFDCQHCIMVTICWFLTSFQKQWSSSVTSLMLWVAAHGGRVSLMAPGLACSPSVWEVEWVSDFCSLFSTEFTEEIQNSWKVIHKMISNGSFQLVPFAQKFRIIFRTTEQSGLTPHPEEGAFYSIVYSRGKQWFFLTKFAVLFTVSEMTNKKYHSRCWFKHRAVKMNSH